MDHKPTDHPRDEPSPGPSAGHGATIVVRKGPAGLTNIIRIRLGDVSAAEIPNLGDQSRVNGVLQVEVMGALLAYASRSIAGWPTGVQVSQVIRSGRNPNPRAGPGSRAGGVRFNPMKTTGSYEASKGRRHRRLGGQRGAGAPARRPTCRGRRKGRHRPPQRREGGLVTANMRDGRSIFGRCATRSSPRPDSFRATLPQDLKLLETAFGPIRKRRQAARPARQGLHDRHRPRAADAAAARLSCAALVVMFSIPLSPGARHLAARPCRFLAEPSFRSRAS